MTLKEIDKILYDIACEANPQLLRLEKAKTLEGAVEILNEYHHRACSNWMNDGVGVRAAYPPDGWESMSEFEAIAVAEKYIREAK